MKIIFMGTPEFSVPILKALNEKYEVCLVVSQPNRVKKKGVLLDTPVAACAKELNLELFQPTAIKDDYQKILDMNADVLVTAAYGQYVPTKILNSFKKCLNVHASLLPKHRGGAPIQRCLINGDSKTGVAIMEMVKRLDAFEYINNPYYQLIKGFNKKYKNCELKYDYYDPFEGFVFDDFIKYPNGKLLPQIGYFNKTFKYPAVYEANHLWMSITPNEINTMKKDIDDSFGNVLTYGLGLGYFPFMVSLKENVKSVTIIEKNSQIIKLFKENILPQFPNKDKIKIINDDAFIFAQNIKNKEYDFIFVDLWHSILY